MIGSGGPEGRRVPVDSRFWQSATIAVGGGSALAVFLFGFAGGIVDRAGADDIAPRTIFPIVVAVALGVSAVLAWRGTQRAKGAALGFMATGLLVAAAWWGTA